MTKAKTMNKEKEMVVDKGTNETIFYDIVKQLGVIATYETGWKKELNLVSWNGCRAKYDIRVWSPNHHRMTKGITLSGTEMKNLISLLA